MKEYVKFTGKFTDLIQDGWRFWKAFARNYRVYSKSCDGQRYSQGCDIWQHLGGYFEISSIDEIQSTRLVKKIAAGEIEDWLSPLDSTFIEDKKRCWLFWDNNLEDFHPWHSPEMVAMRLEKCVKWKEFENKTISPEEYDTWYDNIERRFQQINFRLELLDMIQDLLNKGWIKITEDKRK